MSESLPAVAVAVLLVGDRYALQHRDDAPDIAWPGHWGLFGGVVEPGETAAEAIARELQEETGLAVPDCRPIWNTAEHRDAWGRRRELFVFTADVTSTWADHRLGEGQGTGVFAIDELPTPMVPMARAMIERHRASRAPS
jgi:8-oxo-dGTP diphosphatase